MPRASLSSTVRRCRGARGRMLPVFAGIAFLSCASAAGRATAQYSDPAPASQSTAPVPGTSLDRPRFSVDATIQLGEQGVPEVRVDYRLNRGELLFERTADGYRAGYEVRVIFYSSKGKRQVTGDT